MIYWLLWIINRPFSHCIPKKNSPQNTFLLYYWIVRQYTASYIVFTHLVHMKQQQLLLCYGQMFVSTDWICERFCLWRSLVSSPSVLQVNIRHFAAKCSTFFSQLVRNFVRVLFGAGQVYFYRFIQTNYICCKWHCWDLRLKQYVSNISSVDEYTCVFIIINSDLSAPGRSCIFDLAENRQETSGLTVWTGWEKTRGGAEGGELWREDGRGRPSKRRSFTLRKNWKINWVDTGRFA